jgi:hypothetical protein
MLNGHSTSIAEPVTYYRNSALLTTCCAAVVLLRSRWGCQWTSSCAGPTGSISCAPILQSFGQAAAAIWQVDPTVPIFVNGLGQDHNDKWLKCGNAYPGMHWVSDWCALLNMHVECHHMVTQSQQS